MMYSDALRAMRPDLRGGSDDDQDYDALFLVVDSGVVDETGNPVYVRTREGLPGRQELEDFWAAYVPPVRWSAAQLLLRFSDYEADAIDTANTPLTRKVMRVLQTNTDGVLSDSATLRGLMAQLVQAELVSPERADQILDPEWSPE